MTVFPNKHSANVFFSDGGNGGNVHLSAKNQPKVSAFSSPSAVASQAAPGQAPTTIVPLNQAMLPSQDYLSAIPLFELLSLMRALLAMDSIAATQASTAMSADNDQSRLSALGYLTVLPTLHTHALRMLRLVIISSRRAAVLPYAKQIAQWLLHIFTKTAPALSATSLGAAPHGGVTGNQPQLAAIPSSAMSLHHDRLRALAYECSRALVETVGVAPIYHIFLSKALPQLLADVAAFMTRLMVLARDTKRIYAASAKVDDDEDLLMVGMGARNRRKAKKQRKAEILASLPGANFGAATAESSDEEEEDTKQQSNAKPSTKQAPTAVGTDKSMSAAFSSLHSSLVMLAQYKSYRATVLHDSNGHYAPGAGVVAVDNSSHPALAHSVHIGLSSAALLPVAPAFGSEAELASQTTIVSTALSLLISTLHSASAAAMFSSDLRSAIDRSLLTVLLACVDAHSQAVLPVPVSILRLLIGALAAAVRLPSTQPACLSPLLTYATSILTWASSHNDTIVASSARNAMLTVRGLVSPAAPPPALPAATVSALQRVHEASSNSEMGLGADQQQSGSSIFGQQTNSGSGNNAEAGDSSFPLHLFHYQRPFSYADVDPNAMLNDEDTLAQTGRFVARPANNVVLKSNDHPASLFSGTFGEKPTDAAPKANNAVHANSTETTDAVQQPSAPQLALSDIAVVVAQEEEKAATPQVDAAAQSINMTDDAPVSSSTVTAPAGDSTWLTDAPDAADAGSDDDEEAHNQSMADGAVDLVDADDGDDDNVGLWSL
jgi:hypothetical protein